MSIRIHAGFRRLLTITGTDRFGNAVTPENLVTTTTDSAILATDHASPKADGTPIAGNQFWVNAQGQAGTASVNLDGDGREGDGVAPFSTVIDFEALAGDMVAANVSVGAGGEEPIPSV